MMTLVNWLDLLEQRHPQVIDLGLERCGIVYNRLGRPKPAKKVFTVAGTNGKGSTVAYLAAISGALGQRHGTYTSPHIFRFNERVCILGEPVSEDGLTQAFEQVEKARGDVSLTYFEFTTLAAFLILHQAELDCAILEVGLGGRLDTVNLVDTDCVSCFEPISITTGLYLGQRDTEPRLVIMGRVKLESEGESRYLNYLNIHLNTLSGEREGNVRLNRRAGASRLHQIELILDNIVSAYQETTRYRMPAGTQQSQRDIWVIGGDFNTTPDSDEINMIRQSGFTGGQQNWFSVRCCQIRPRPLIFAL